jgi:pimeloyl-ACP methyl ester carboxylesterase
LLKADHRCIAIDLLGFGSSPVPAHSEYTLGEHCAAIERTIDRLRLRTPFTLVGHSMGSLIGARYAARNPRRVGKLVLVSPPVYVAPAELSDVVERAKLDLYLKAYAYIRANKTFTLHHAQVVERLLPIPKAMDINEGNWDAFVKSLMNSIESQTTISDLAAVRAPIEVVYGDLDEFHSEGVLKIVRRLSGVTVHKVRGSDHLIGMRLARVVASAVTTASAGRSA